jgi:hypothetical protein
LVTVDYRHELLYSFDETGRRYPRLTLQLVNPARTDVPPVEVDAYVDSDQVAGKHGCVMDGKTPFCSSFSPLSRFLRT